MFKQNLRKYLRQFYGTNELKQWFDPLGFNHDELNGILHIYFPHAYFLQWFKKNWGDLFEERIIAFVGGTFIFKYHYTGHARTTQFQLLATDYKNNPLPFGKEYTFENYAFSEGSEFLLKSAQKAASGDSSFNPYTVTGLPGSGKTHILRAIANELAANFGSDSIFLGDVLSIKSIYTSKFQNNIHSARTYFEGFKFFLLDDVHKAADDKPTTEELLVITEGTAQKGHLVVFSTLSDYLKVITADDKLKLFIKSGLIAHTEKADIQAKIAYVNNFCIKNKIRLAKKQILEVAGMSGGFAEIRGFFQTIIARKEILKEKINERDLEKLIAGKIEGGTKSSNQINQIISIVSEYYQIPKNELTGTKRIANILQARQVAIYLCREILGFSYPEIGRIFGGKDHSTIMHSVKKISLLLEVNQKMKDSVLDLKKRCSYFSET